MINTIKKIHNFKCFKDFKLSELGRITLIGGKNGIGKSALLEALFLFHDSRNANRIIRLHAWRGMNVVNILPKNMLAPLFNNLDLARDILIDLVIDGKLARATYRYNPNFVPPPSSVGETPPATIPTDQLVTPSYSLEITYQRAGNNAETSHVYIGTDNHAHMYPPIKIAFPVAAYVAVKAIASTNTIADYFSDMSREGVEDELLEAMKVIEPRLEKLTVITEGPTSVVHGKLKHLSKTIPIAYMGQGHDRLLSILLHIFHCANGTVFLDEIDAGLHTSILKDIWKTIITFAKTKQTQIIATTHRYEFIQSVHDAMSDAPEDLCYIRLDRLDGNIIPKVYDYETLGITIENKWELR